MARCGGRGLRVEQAGLSGEEVELGGVRCAGTWGGLWGRRGGGGGCGEVMGTRGGSCGHRVGYGATGRIMSWVLWGYGKGYGDTGCCRDVGTF